MAEYKQKRPIDGQKPRMVILNGRAIVVDKNPSKERLDKAILWSFKYNENNTCYRCIKEGKTIEESQLHTCRTYQERDKEQRKTGEWICINHWNKDHQKHNHNSRNNALKSIANCRTIGRSPGSNQEKGDIGEELLCRWKKYKNLNKENDNYSRGTPIDCQCPTTGLYYQVKIAYYSSIYRSWKQDSKGLQNSISQGFIFKSLFLFCIGKDGKIVERTYEIPEKEIISRTSIGVYKYDSEGRPWKNGWYEKYRINDEDELKKVNKIWQRILEENYN